MAMRLNNREKYAVFTMVLFVAVFIAVQFIVFPLLDKRARLDRVIEVKRKTIAELKDLHREYREIGRQSRLIRESFAKRERGFTLFSFLDRLAGQAGIKDKITYMKPSTLSSKEGGYKTSLVEMKIEGVTVNRLAPYLKMVETSENVVTIRRLSLSAADKRDGYINVVMQVEAMET